MKYTSDNTEKSNLRLALDAMRVSIDFFVEYTAKSFRKY